MSNKRIEKKKKTRFKKEILEFVGDISSRYAAIVLFLKKRKSLVLHSLCNIDEINGSGRVVNSRCRGAWLRCDVCGTYKKVVAVVWNADEKIDVGRYIGTSLIFSEFESLKSKRRERI